MARECGIDRLSALHDSILTCNIFSYLSLRDVVRTSVLSTRWRFLWRQIPHLHFSQEYFLPLGFPDTDCPVFEIQKANSIIDNILGLHSGHIEKFSIEAFFKESEGVEEGLHLEQWIHYAALNEVKHVSIHIPILVMDMPSSLFACHLLRGLELDKIRFTGIPTGFHGFRFLQSCSLTNVDDLMDDGLKQLLGLCPILHKLVLYGCYELTNLEIEAPNLRSLTVVECFEMKSLTVDCPQLVELKIEMYFNRTKLKLNSCVVFHGLHMSDVRILKEHPMLNSLRKLWVNSLVEVSDLTLLTTLGCFRNLEELHIQMFGDDDYLEQAFEREQGEVVADSNLPSLKKAYVVISSKMKKAEAIMLAFLLNNAPSLKTMKVTLPYCPANIHDTLFINKVLDLQKIYVKVDIRMKIAEYRLDETCKCMETAGLKFDVHPCPL